MDTRLTTLWRVINSDECTNIEIRFRHDMPNFSRNTIRISINIINKGPKTIATGQVEGTWAQEELDVLQYG